MDRANVPTKVEVRQADLRTIERTKSFHILSRFLDTSQPGGVQGLDVLASSVGLQRYDILAGYGYTPNGEYVELTQTIEGQSPNAIQVTPTLVGLMYREIEQRDGAAETDGVARPREVVRSSELLEFDQAAWDALPDSFDSNLTVNAKDRFLICAVVEVPITASDPLTIELPPTFSAIKSMQARLILRWL